jgi:uncharacterized protein
LKNKILIFLFILPVFCFAQGIPDKPVPPRLVNDFAGILSASEVNLLESKLVSFNDSTSTQIAVVIVKSLNGYDKLDFAQRLGQKWGIGQKGKNNGCLILVKPKYAMEKGEAAIQTGYGIEGVLPDALCERIVDNEMIPAFHQGNYYQGILNAVTTIQSITRGEYTADQYMKRSGQHAPYGILVPVIIMIFMIFWLRGNRGKTHSVGKSLPFWASMWLLGSMGRGHSGTWGDFQSGGGIFGGGGGGGFGGFGGGGFGGGGAGGSW